MTDEPPHKPVEGHARTVSQLLTGRTYVIDFYQREYAWKERQVRELVHDLTTRFLEFYRPEHEIDQTQEYGHYFLGPIVVSHKRGQHYIVDGQQRLTTLTLLFIYLHHQLEDAEEKAEALKLVYRTRRRRKSFNLDVPERTEVMRALLDDSAPPTDGLNQSCARLVARYADIGQFMPEELRGDALAGFMWWLMDNVHLVEIEAYSPEDAYSIFETMNDRGLSLSLPEMLKGYVLANIRHEVDQREVNRLWRGHMQALKDLGHEEEVDFFKNWLRARYANSFQSKGTGERRLDYERIGSEFHRWVRDQRETLGLRGSDDFARWVKRDMDFYARQTVAIRTAATQLTTGLESIRYNEERAFTQQTQVLLAALLPTDPQQTTLTKLRLVADALDIWLARRAWCFRTTAQRNTKGPIFQLTKRIRGLGLSELSEALTEFLDEQAEGFAQRPDFHLTKMNYRQARHLLARLTLWLDQQCGLPSHFDDLVSRGRARRFEIEHIWPNRYEQFTELYEHPADFDRARNGIGMLLLIQQGINQSMGDDTYEQKVEAYVSKGQNLLAASLHPMAYDNNPAFRALVDRTGLDFRPHATMGLADLAQRTELYVRLAEWVWNPARVSLSDPDAPPTPQTFGGSPGGTGSSAGRERRPNFRQERRLAFWTALLEHAATVTENHRNCTPSNDGWIGMGAGRAGLGFNYVVLMESTRAELYCNLATQTDNKALFDALSRLREDIEARFGGPLTWQRLDEKKTCRISVVIDAGGWSTPEAWDAAIPATVAAMDRLIAALRPALATVRSS